MLRPCDIHQPAAVADASRLRAPLLLVIEEGVLRDTPLIDVKDLDGLTEVRVDADTICLAALATHSAIEHSSVVDAHILLLAEVERTVANLPL